MTKHYVLNLNPAAQHEWDRCALRHPITAERPELASLIAEAVGCEPGSYLVAIDIEVKILEKAPIAQSDRVPLDLTTVRVAPARKELAA
ncbi:MAG: hypothetical protein KME17_25850 [Cyanosarcina radialis HA8281-LM2]|nr:hypothetical protein [Cyanosarcina radialis HA8281-LM2]